MSKSIRILHIIDSLGVGGAEKLLISVVNGLTQFEHHVICLSDNHPLKENLNVEHRFFSLGFKSKKDIYRCVNRVRRYIKENEIDLVHSHLVLSNIVARFAAPKKIPVINSLHNLNGVKLFASLISWARLVEKISYRKRHFIIAVSRAVMDDYDKYIGLKGHSMVLYNFVEDKFFADQPNERSFTDTLRMVAVGSFKEQKNYEFLVEALRGLPPSISLDIYGEGPLKIRIQTLIKETDVRVNLKGNSNAIESIFPKYDLYVMASKFEGHPVALLEAMAAGMPAMLSDIPVLREATENKGIYFRLNAYDDFREKIMDILHHRIDLRPFARHNWELASKHARKSHYLELLAKLYHSQIAANK